MKRLTPYGFASNTESDSDAKLGNIRRLLSSYKEITFHFWKVRDDWSLILQPLPTES